MEMPNSFITMFVLTSLFSVNCSSHQDKSDCERYYLPSHCDVYVNVPEECPTMCKACPCKFPTTFNITLPLIPFQK